MLQKRHEPMLDIGTTNDSFHDVGTLSSSQTFVNNLTRKSPPSLKRDRGKSSGFGDLWRFKSWSSLCTFVPLGKSIVTGQVSQLVPLLLWRLMLHQPKPKRTKMLQDYRVTTYETDFSNRLIESKLVLLQ